MITQHAVLSTVIGGFVWAVVTILGSVTAPAPEIEVHSLVYTLEPIPSVIQTRTVTAESRLVADWSAEVQTFENLGRVTKCTGNGNWKYEGGYLEASIPLDEWVGEAGCFEKIKTADLARVCAVYEWGDGGREHFCSDPFIPFPNASELK